MDWERFIKRYVWDDDRTPYLSPVARLTRRQADYEVYAYAIFVGVLLAVVGLASLLEPAPRPFALGIAAYAWTVVAAAIVLNVSKHVYAALYTGTAPVVAMAYGFAFGLHPNLAGVDHLVLLVFGLLWLAYAFRVLAITRAYPDMAEAPPGDG